jgi:hypothetical protein
MARRKSVGPSESEPYALDWGDYADGVLRAFIMFYPDSEGFDFIAEDVMKLDHGGLVEKCEHIQRDCPKLIDKPWAVEALQMLGDDEVPDEFKALKWSAEDTVALQTLAQSQEKIRGRRQRARTKSPEGRARRSRRSSSGRQENEDEDDENVPLSRRLGVPKAKAQQQPQGEAKSPERSPSPVQRGVPEQRRSPREAKKSRKRSASSSPEDTKGAQKASGGQREMERLRRRQRELQAMVKGLQEPKRGRSKGRGRRHRSSSSSSSSSESSSSSSRRGSSSESSSSGSEPKKKKSKKLKKETKKERQRRLRSRRGRKKERRVASDSKFRERASASMRYQWHLLANEVRGTKVEDATNITELFAAWSDMANVQSEHDESAKASVYAPSGLPRRLADARRQLQEDFKLACRMFPEGPAQEALVLSAERMLLNFMVQQSRSEVLVRKMDLFKMGTKAMEKVRDFASKQVYKGVKEASRTDGWRYQDGKGKDNWWGSKGGTGGGKGGKGGEVDHSHIKCYNCQQFGHYSDQCPLRPLLSQEPWGNAAPSVAVEEPNKTK